MQPKFKRGDRVLYIGKKRAGNGKYRRVAGHTPHG